MLQQLTVDVHTDKAKIKQAKDARTEKANEARGGADIGKIVSLMSVDANRVSALFGVAYMLLFLCHTPYPDCHGHH